MILLNGYKKNAVYKMNRNATVTLKDVTGKSVTSNFNGSWNNFYDYMTQINTNRSNLKSNGVVFGTGNTAPALGDYCLSGDFIKGFAASYTIEQTDADDGYTMSVVYTITNNNSEAITIGEVGIVEYAHNGNNVNGYVLTERTALDTPVTIPAGGVGQITYTVRMNYPTA